jgi:hypothetical protein
LCVEIWLIPRLKSNEIIAKDLLTLLHNTERIRGVIEKRHTW